MQNGPIPRWYLKRHPRTCLFFGPLGTSCITTFAHVLRHNFIIRCEPLCISIYISASTLIVCGIIITPKYIKWKFNTEILVIINIHHKTLPIRRCLFTSLAHAEKRVVPRGSFRSFATQSFSLSRREASDRFRARGHPDRYFALTCRSSSKLVEAERVSIYLPFSSAIFGCSHKFPRE